MESRGRPKLCFEPFTNLNSAIKEESKEQHDSKFKEPYDHFLIFSFYKLFFAKPQLN